MAYTRPPSKSTGDTFDLTAYNAIRDSLIAGIDVVTTKGDLLVGTAADTVTRLGVGTDDSIIVADSGTASGLAWQIVPHCLVTRSEALDPTPDEWVPVTWDVEGVDTHAMHSTSSNTHRITIPAGGAGRYRVGANIGFLTSVLTPGDNGFYGVRILYNGSTVVGVVQDDAEMYSQDHWVYIDMPSGPSVGDFYEVQVWTSQNIDISKDSKFWAEWQRR